MRHGQANKGDRTTESGGDSRQEPGDNQKPVAIYNYRHFYDDLANLLTKMSNQGFLEKQYLHAIAFATSLDEILSFMTNYQAPHFRSYQ